MIKNLLLLIVLIFIYSCQSVKDALQGKKYESSDEFLVIKKNPLVMPPDFKMLPVPKDPEQLSREQSVEAEIEDILSSIKSENITSDQKQPASDKSSTEDFVLEQIKK
tara:strand:- start:319 stop:642 length:324 start_codon:yes stop_codon:yes gene_type:complete